MKQHHHTDDLQAALEALNAVFEAEEREDPGLRLSAAVRASLSRSGTSGRSPASRTEERLPATDREVRQGMLTHVSSKSTLATAYSQRSRSRSGTRCVRAFVARSAASKAVEIRACCDVVVPFVMHLDRSLEERQSTVITG